MIQRTRNPALAAVGIQIAILVMANIIAVLLVEPMAYVLSQPEFLPIDQEIDSLLRYPNFAFFIPFPVILVTVIIYIWPIVGSARSDGMRLAPKAMVRLLNAPFTYAMFTIAGWLAGSLVFVVAALRTGVDIPGWYLFQVAFVSFVISSIAFVITYYVVDLIERIYIIPILVPDGGLANLPHLARATTRVRLVILYVVGSLLPIIVLYRIVIILNAGGSNPYGTDLALRITVLVAMMSAVALAITLLKANAIAKPVEQLAGATARIAADDFTVRVPVVSTDELGVLSERMNQMASGLHDRERMRDVFGRAVDPTVRDRLLSGTVDLGGEERTVAVLFADIVSFTTLSEGMRPTDVVQLLNTVFTECAARVADHGGYVDKYIGDEIMAVFGAPVPVENAAASAVRAAESILEAVPRIDAALEMSGYPSIRLRAGIHYGPVLAGTIGSESRLEYTVIGDTVNSASRLVGAAKEHDVEALVSRECWQAAGIDGELRSAGALQLRGRSAALEALVLR